MASQSRSRVQGEGGAGLPAVHKPAAGGDGLCVDEKTQLQALRRRFPGRAPAPGRPGRYEFEYRRGGVLALIGAFDVATGQVFAQCRERRSAADLVAFMEAVAEQYPTGIVYVVWDNLDIHRDGKDGRWKAFNARHGGRRRVVRYGDFADVNDLARKLLAFVRYWNRVEAHPFRWTFRGRFREDQRTTWPSSAPRTPTPPRLAASYANAVA